MKNPKYNKEIKPGVVVDVYDVLNAWGVQNPALQHLIKKALQAGKRGHKDTVEDMEDIIASAIRAKEIEEEKIIKKKLSEKPKNTNVNFLYV